MFRFLYISIVGLWAILMKVNTEKCIGRLKSSLFDNCKKNTFTVACVGTTLSIVPNCNLPLPICYYREYRICDSTTYLRVQIKEVHRSIRFDANELSPK